MRQARFTDRGTGKRRGMTAPPNVLPTRLGLAKAHGLFNTVGGLWPLVHRRSFEALFGAKYDRWLQYTVGGLLAGNGVVQLLADDTPSGYRGARNLGISTAITLLTIDLVYVPAGRIRKTYLVDAAMEAAWLAAWAKRTEP